MPSTQQSTIHEWLNQALTLCSLACTDASTITSFVGRWRAVARKLHLLSTYLAQLVELPGFVSNPLCIELLQVVVNTLHEARQLASRCCNSEDCGGKLQMQSSLDALSMKLETHLHDSNLLINSGVLQASGTRSEASREAAKWKVKDLIARLQFGNVESKQKPLEDLVELMERDEKNILLVAGQGGVPILIHLLDVSLTSIREKAASAVCCLCQVESNAHLLVTEGVLAPMVRLLECSSPVAKEKAGTALEALTLTPENARSVVTHGGVPPLIEICQDGTPPAQAAAAGVLRNLAGVSEFRKNLAEEGAISALVALITSGTAMAQENAANCLQNMTSSDNQLRYFIAKGGGIQALNMYFDAATTWKAQEVAMGALTNIAAFGANLENLLASGFVSRIVAGLCSGQSLVQIVAANSVCHVATSIELRRLLGEAGCIPPLVRMLEAKAIAAQEIATKAIFSLILSERNRKEIRKEEQCIPGMVDLLDPSNQNVSKKFPISVLLCLSGNKKSRKQMVSAGACNHLEKLAEMEIAGAKKLLERLERAGLWNIFKV